VPQHPGLPVAVDTVIDSLSRPTGGMVTDAGLERSLFRED
jgi:hypothetical protein